MAGPERQFKDVYRNMAVLYVWNFCEQCYSVFFVLPCGTRGHYISIILIVGTVYSPLLTLSVVDTLSHPIKNVVIVRNPFKYLSILFILLGPEVLYKIIECIPVVSWSEFIRRLGVSNYVIATSEHDNRHYKEAQYAMLSSWVHNDGSRGATMDSLFRVLREMNLGGCVEKIEEGLWQFPLVFDVLT